MRAQSGRTFFPLSVLETTSLLERHMAYILVMAQFLT